jgi:chaperonin GroEL (HSP60 family)
LFPLDTLFSKEVTAVTGSSVSKPEETFKEIIFSFVLKTEKQKNILFINWRRLVKEYGKEKYLSAKVTLKARG